MSALAPFRGSPGLRSAAAAIFLYGASGAVVAPYKSIVAIRELGMTDAQFSALTLAAAAVNVAASIAVGIAADRGGRYRHSAVLAALAGALGYGMVWAIGTGWALVLAMLLPIAVFGAMNSLLFAAARVFSLGLAKRDADAVSSSLRALISVAWILIPGLTGLALATSPTLLPAFGAAALVALAIAGVLTFTMPKGAGRDAPRPPRLGLGATLAILARPAIALRVLGVALISAVLHVNQSVMPLITTGSAGGTTADVGIVLGLVAALEVAFILVWSRATRHLTPVAALGAGIAIYTLYLCALAAATAPWHIYAASVLGGIGAAAIISLPIGYLLDLIEGRPGLSASLISVNIFLGGSIGAGLFALGTAVGGYGTVALLGAAAGVAGVALLVTLDGGRVRVAG